MLSECSLFIGPKIEISWCFPTNSNPFDVFNVHAEAYFETRWLKMFSVKESLIWLSYPRILWFNMRYLER